jgi:hypothetical protein
MIEIRWQEQYERMKRYLARASEPMIGADREAHNQRVLDDLASFFVFCFHLKDWLKGDPQSGIGHKEVENFVRQSESLSLCGDLANASKHAALKAGSVRADPNPRVQGGTLTSDLGPLRFVGSWFAVVTSKGEEHDALSLARQCLAEWDGFLKANCLI